MKHQFRKHYTREEARSLLPNIRQWLGHIIQWREELTKLEGRLHGLMTPGSDLGGELVNRWVKTLADLEDEALKFQRHGIFLKDVDRGLVDFPAIIGGKEVFLCWEQDEEDIEFWHDLDTGYAGRERL